jgi:transcriptional regulator with XRE-family HTH domain
MTQPDKQAIRRKVMGTLLRNARLSSGRSQSELATALHVSKYRYSRYERGSQEISLAELECVAELCGLPLGHFFDDEASVEDESLEILHEIAPRIRRKVVGILLRQVREVGGKSQKELATLLGISQQRLSQYEKGEQEMRPAELEAAANGLNVDVAHFAI